MKQPGGGKSPPLGEVQTFWRNDDRTTDDAMTGRLPPG